MSAKARAMWIFFFLLLYVGYLSYGWFAGWLYERNVQNCIEGYAENEVFATFDNNQMLDFCQCGMMPTKDDPFFDKNDTVFKAKMTNNSKNCLIEHIDKYGYSGCSTFFNEDSDVHNYLKMSLDCSCFAKEAISRMDDIENFGVLDMSNFLYKCMK
ncbi:MAG: hypothetical protein ACRBDI_00715 [Alphaproteobacteria bacterium]